MPRENKEYSEKRKLIWKKREKSHRCPRETGNKEEEAAVIEEEYSHTE